MKPTNNLSECALGLCPFDEEAARVLHAGVKVLVEMVSHEQIANLHVFLLPVLKLLVECSYFCRKGLVLGEGGQAVDLHLVEIELRVEILRFVCERDGIGLDR